MSCECEACLDDVTTPPIGYVSDLDWKLEMAWDACWQDMGDYE